MISFSIPVPLKIGSPVVVLVPLGLANASSAIVVMPVGIVTVPYFARGA